MKTLLSVLVAGICLLSPSCASCEKALENQTQTNTLEGIKVPSSLEGAIVEITYQDQQSGESDTLYFTVQNKVTYITGENPKLNGKPKIRKNGKDQNHRRSIPGSLLYE